MKKKMTLLSLAIICIIIGVLMLVKLRSSGFWVDNYWTTSYFSEAKFKEIKADMSCEQVRDLIGIPLLRKLWTTAGWHWIYSQPVDPNKPYRKFVTVFDNDTNKVVRSFQSVSRAFKDPKTGQWADLSTPPALPWEITHFNYPMSQGEPPAVKSGAQKMHLIQMMATCCGAYVKGRARIEKLLKEDLSDVPLQLLLVSVDESQEALQKYLNENQVTVPVAWDPNDRLSRSMNQKLIPKYLLLKGKTLYPFDFPHFAGESEEYYDDLVWFIRYHTGSPL
ncbi:MAG: outer membrane protein assembly factor BamE [Sedimentisphaerales bacterium]